MILLMRLAGVLSEAVRFCYPSACLCCEQPADGKFCTDCEGELQKIIDRPRCSICARPLADGSDCPYCKGRGVYPFERIATLGVFETALKELIHSMKYHRRWTIGEDLADRLAARREVVEIVREADVLIPVPLWRWRQVRRGYNQADVIASHLARRFEKKVSRAIVRTRRTASQTELRSGKSRVDNVREAFALKLPRAIKRQRIVVIDDVMTSGATMKEVGRTILEAEPTAISAIALAVADPRGRGFTVI